MAIDLVSAISTWIKEITGCYVNYTRYFILTASLLICDGSYHVRLLKYELVTVRLQSSKETAQQHPKNQNQCVTSYDVNLKLMMVKHAEKTNNCVTKRKLCRGTECTTLEEKRILLLKRTNSAWKDFRWFKQGYFNLKYEKDLESVPEKL